MSSKSAPPGPKRIDVSAPPSPLKQNPFAALAARPLEQTPSATTDEPPVPSPAPSPAAPPKPRSLGRLVLRRETKHRGGKTVVIISGFNALGLGSVALATRLRDVEKHLKGRLGCGGASEPATGEVLIQGDRPEAIADLLRDLGYTVTGVTQKPGGR